MLFSFLNWTFFPLGFGHRLRFLLRLFGYFKSCSSPKRYGGGLSFCKAMVAPRAPACFKSYSSPKRTAVAQRSYVIIFCKALVALRAPACFKSYGSPKSGGSSKIYTIICKALVAPRAPACFKSYGSPKSGGGSLIVCGQISPPADALFLPK